jgi:alpha-tubulin suppressor-like RCC1 family protein
MARANRPATLRALLCLPLIAAVPGCDDSTGPTPITDPRLATALTAQGEHTCVIAGDGTTWCWGHNEAGQLGDGTREARMAPVAVATTSRFVSMSAGGQHTCALTGDGHAWCWGSNVYGELGEGSQRWSDTPVEVAGQHRFASIHAGYWLTCALEEGGTAWCWGFDLAAYEDGTSEPRTAPVQVETDLRFRSLAAGIGTYACGIASEPSGSAWCWGSNEFGQLGDGTQQDRLAPVASHPGRTFEALAVGWGHTCGILADGSILCWGLNHAGQLGDGQATPGTAQVHPPDGRFAAVAVGMRHSCALTDDGAAYCWGDNTQGQLGDGTAAVQEGLVGVGGAERFERIAAGQDHTCASTRQGVVYCWGSNEWGQLGDGSGSFGWAAPVLVRW